MADFVLCSPNQFLEYFDMRLSYDTHSPKTIPYATFTEKRDITHICTCSLKLVYEVSEALLSCVTRGKYDPKVYNPTQNSKIRMMFVHENEPEFRLARKLTLEKIGQKYVTSKSKPRICNNTVNLYLRKYYDPVRSLSEKYYSGGGSNVSSDNNSVLLHLPKLSGKQTDL